MSTNPLFLIYEFAGALALLCLFGIGLIWVIEKLIGKL